MKKGGEKDEHEEGETQAMYRKRIEAELPEGVPKFVAHLHEEDWG